MDLLRIGIKKGMQFFVDRTELNNLKSNYEQTAYLDKSTFTNNLFMLLENCGTEIIHHRNNYLEIIDDTTQLIIESHKLVLPCIVICNRQLRVLYYDMFRQDVYMINHRGQIHSTLREMDDITDYSTPVTLFKEIPT
jgi:hypothetical protein